MPVLAPSWDYNPVVSSCYASSMEEDSDYSDRTSSPEDSPTVLSDDIWKKFDLDLPNLEKIDINMEVPVPPSPGPTILPEFFDTFFNRESCEIRHHDCMWAGLCISKEHNRTLPAKKDRGAAAQRSKIPAGRSILISKVAQQHHQQHRQQMQQQGCQQQPQQQKEIVTCPQQQQQQIQQQKLQNIQNQTQMTTILEEDTSCRPDTPQSSNDSDYESEESSDDDVPIFKHDQISLNDKLSELMTTNSSDEASNTNNNQPQNHSQQMHRHQKMQMQAVHVSEVSGQQVTAARKQQLAYQQQRQQQQLQQQRGHQHYHQHYRIKDEVESNESEESNEEEEDEEEEEEEDEEEDQEDERQDCSYYAKETTNQKNNAMSDHSYHLNQQSMKRLDDLGVQTPSDSEEEEIDVVSYEKPTRLPNSSLLEQQKQQHQRMQAVSAALTKQTTKNPTGRPRGRPPSSATAARKRQAALLAKEQSCNSSSSESTPAKRTRHHAPLTPAPSPSRSPLHHQNHHHHNSHHHNARSPQQHSHHYHAHHQQSGNQRHRGRVAHNNHQHSKSSPTKSGTTTSRSGSSDSEPDTERRSLHNNMERQRREDLKKFFEDLRRLVPEIQSAEKAPKVTILRQAVKYCQKLTENDKRNQLEMMEAQRRNRALHQRWRELRKYHKRLQNSRSN